MWKFVKKNNQAIPLPFRRGIKITGTALLGILLLLLLVGFVFSLQDKSRSAASIQDIDWGVTFSEKMSRDFGLDWKENYSAIVHDLKPQGIRLIAYWDLVQPMPDTWDFTNLDWQVDEAAKQNIPIIISVGQKVPRWPECHYPTWLDIANKSDREARLLTYIQTVVQRYKDRSNILYWQVENEPFLNITVINCPKTSYRFVQQEVNLVKRLDPKHQVILTDSGQVGTWYKAARLGDAFGLTYYLKVHNPDIGHYRYPYIPGRISLMPWLTGKKDQPMMVIEQQGEPWSDKQIYEMPIERQISLFTTEELKESINLGRKLGFSTQYLWGVEWWYSLKQKGHPEYWDLIKTYTDARRGALMFPTGFYWGASTSAHQVEGSQTNDWTEWEKANANRLASEAESELKEKVPNWELIKAQATDPKNYISGRASDHYNRFPEDFDAAQSLDMNAQRISLEWSRIESREGQFNQEALDHYASVIKALKDRGMEPFVTLWHYTVPQWFADQGGWLNPKAPEQFERYTKKIAETFGNDVTYWMTINEPGIYSSNAYYLGVRPPQHTSGLDYIRVINQLIKTHNQAYTTLKSIDPNAQVGIAHDAYSFSATNWPHHWIGFRLARWWRNTYFLDRIQHHQDFIGLNYYIDVPIGQIPKTDKVSDLGWQLYPEGLYNALKDVKRYNVPIYITENGLADDGDSRRAQYIRSVATQTHRAIQDGIDVRGYFHWSLIDNFEWEKGFWPRFGLVEVDYATQRRTIRSSAYEYAEIIKNNSLQE